jgi:MSHA pilin protein MshC
VGLVSGLTNISFGGMKLFFKWNFRKKQNGFTLIELILTIVILSILSAIAAPRFVSSASEAFQFSQGLRTTLRYAQQTAVASNSPVCVKFSATRYTVTYVPEGGASCASSQYVTNPANQQPWNGTKTGQGLAPEGITLPDTTITFEGLGAPDNALELNIAGYTVKVEAETGYVH